MKLAKLNLDPSWIDLSYGEPVLIKTEIAKLFPQFTYNTNTLSYPLAAGIKELTSLLEAKYNSKVVVANGAKQAMSAAFYALKKLGHAGVTIHSPYWVSTPKLIEAQGLIVRDLKDTDTASSAFLLTSPNNPDGKEFHSSRMIEMHSAAKDDNVTFIHDAAYYTPIYVNDPSDILPKFADAQVFSFSKMYGLSGLRIGYLVVNDDRLYQYATEFIEGSTSGVSVPAQLAALEVEQFFLENPDKKIQFENTCRSLMEESRSELKNLDPDVLTWVNTESKGMFAWCKPGPKLDTRASKVHAVDGLIFGASGMLRMNICFPKETIKQAVERLNNGRSD